MRSETVTGIGLVVAWAVPLMAMGCGGQPGDAGETQALSFSTPAELYEWMGEEAGRENLGDVVARRDATGAIVSVTMSPGSRDRLMEALQGEVGYFTLKGERVDLSRALTAATFKPAKPVSDAEFTEVTSALSSSASACSGSFCASGSSYNDHYTLFGIGYHDVGTSTAAKAANTIYSTYAPSGGTVCGPCRTSCTCVTNYTCNPGDTLIPGNSASRLPTPPECRHSYGRVAVQGAYFKNVSGTPVTVGSIFDNQTASQFAGVELTAFGSALYWGDYPEAGISGICGFHYATGNGGSVSLSTGAGSYSGC